MQRITTKAILKAIGHKNLDLFRDPTGYFYFVYDNGDNIYSTKSVDVFRLNQWTFGDWVDAGKDFVKEIEDLT